MLEQITSLQIDIFRMPPEVAIPVGIVLFLILIRVALALPDLPRPAVADHGREMAARRWIDDRIDEHVDRLAEAYLQAGMATEPDDLPPGFAITIEAFIGDVLLRRLDSAGLDSDLRAAVREFAVLHRAQICEDVVTRTRKYLAL